MKTKTKNFILESSYVFGKSLGFLIKALPTIIVSSVIFAFIVVCFSSCNVTRVVTTSSEYFQRGDTSCMIQTKTVETYDAMKH